MSATTCDYTANGGYLESREQDFALTDHKKRGATPFLANRYTQGKVKLADFRDGASNTLLLWESAGKEWYSNPNGEKSRRTWDEWHGEYGEVKMYLDENRQLAVRCTSRNSHGYLYGWAGFNRARLRVWDEDGMVWGPQFDEPTTFYRVINATNSYRSPFGFHPTTVNVAMADGSVRTVNENTTAEVFVALTSRWGSESVQLP